MSSQSIRQSSRFDKIREQQLASLGYDFINNLELTGKGITIAIFDGGFPGVDKHDGLMFLVENKQITEPWKEQLYWIQAAE